MTKPLVMSMRSDQHRRFVHANELILVDSVRYINWYTACVVVPVHRWVWSVKIGWSDPNQPRHTNKDTEICRASTPAYFKPDAQCIVRQSLCEAVTSADDMKEIEVNS